MQDHRQPGPILEPEVEQAADHDPRAPGGEQDAEAGVGGPEALLGVDDLDRDDDREADQHERLADQQRAHGPEVTRELQAVDEALAPRRAVLVLGVREIARDEQDDRDHGERRRVDQQRGREAEHRDQPARQRGAEDRRDREAEVHQRVALAEQVLGLQQHAYGAAREPAAGDGERAVDRAQQEHERQEEAIAAGQQRQDGEDAGPRCRRARAASCAARTGPGAR